MLPVKTYNVAGYAVLWYDSLSSTNTVATEQAIAGGQDKTVLVADYQTAGRGQRHNKWDSEKGKNLTFSVIFRPHFLLVEQQFVLLKALSLGVCDYLSGIGINVRIKWPNDIYVGNCKIAGMLIEHSVMGECLSFSIAGIGLNVNQQVFDTAVPNPISIQKELHTEMDRAAVLEGLLQCIDARYTMLSQGSTANIDSDYFNRLYRADGKFYPYESAKQVFNARINGISEIGELLLEDERGVIRSFAFKEVSYII